MKRTILITIMALIAGLFIAGQGLAAGEYGHEKGQAGMGESQGAGMAHQMNNEQVREMQKLLNEKGFNAGPVDGIIGPKTTSAVRDFQESRGLAATGNPDRDTLQELAPDAETQEQLGLSPEFGEQGMEKQPETGKEKKHEGAEMKEEGTW